MKTNKLITHLIFNPSAENTHCDRINENINSEDGTWIKQIDSN